MSAVPHVEDMGEMYASMPDGSYQLVIVHGSPCVAFKLAHNNYGFDLAETIKWERRDRYMQQLRLQVCPRYRLYRLGHDELRYRRLY